MFRALLSATIAVAATVSIAQAQEALTVLVPVDWRPIVDDVAADFKDRTGTEIEVVSLAYSDVFNRIVTSVRGGADIDVVYVDTVWPAQLARSEILVPVTDVVTEDMRGGIVPALFDQLSWNGELWAVPFNNQSKWLFYNRELLAAAGYDAPPETWAELEEMSRRMMSDGSIEFGIAWGWDQSEGLIADATAVMAGLGLTWQDADGNWVFDTPEMREALDWMVASIGEGGFADPASISQNDRLTLNPFMAGDTAFVTNWAFAWGLIQNPDESEVVDKVGITVIPGNEAVRSGSVTGGGGFGVTTASDTPDLAKRFVQYMLEQDVQERALDLQQNMPVWTDMYSDTDILARYPHFKAMGPQFQYAKFRPVASWYSEWSNQAQLELQNALTGGKSADEAISDLAEFTAESQERYGD